MFFPSAVSETRLQEITRRVDVIAAAGQLIAEWSGNRHVAMDVTAERGIDMILRELQPEMGDGSVLWEWGDVEGFRT